jgi:predicted nucleic acid-binding protein
VRGWLLDTNVIAALSARDGAPPVKAWAASQNEARFHFSVLTLAEYDRGIHQRAQRGKSPVPSEFGLVRLEPRRKVDEVTGG